MLQSIGSQRVRHDLVIEQIQSQETGSMKHRLANLFIGCSGHQPVPARVFFILVAQLLSHVQFFGTPWTAANQASLSFTISQSLLKFMSIEPVSHPTIFSVALFSSCPQSFPASGSFPMSWLFVSGGQSIGA